MNVLIGSTTKPGAEITPRLGAIPGRCGAELGGNEINLERVGLTRGQSDNTPRYLGGGGWVLGTDRPGCFFVA